MVEHKNVSEMTKVFCTKQLVSIPIIRKNIGDVNLLVVKKLNVRPKPSLLAMILFEHLMNIAMILQLINYNSNISMEIKMFIRFLNLVKLVHWCLYVYFIFVIIHPWNSNAWNLSVVCLFLLEVYLIGQNKTCSLGL